jgi:uncharacterized membrane protein YqjE
MKILTILFTGMTLISCAGLKCWVIIADNLKKAGWSLGSVLFLNGEAGTIWVADTRRLDGKHFVVQEMKS